MRRARLAFLAALMPSLASAQSVAPILVTDFVAVSIEGSVNLRAGPTTASERLARLEDATLLRRVDCERIAEETWCEVETLDAGLEGWIAAEFLVPWFGADPAALDTPAVGADQMAEIEIPGRYGGTLGRGQIVDLLFSLEADGVIEVTVLADDGVGFALFDAEAERLLTARGASGPLSTETGRGDMLLRLADMTGRGGDWEIAVTSD